MLYKTKNNRNLNIVREYDNRCMYMPVANFVYQMCNSVNCQFLFGLTNVWDCITSCRTSLPHVADATGQVMMWPAFQNVFVHSLHVFEVASPQFARSHASG